MSSSLGQPLDGKSVSAPPRDKSAFAGAKCFSPEGSDGSRNSDLYADSSALKVLLVDDHVDMLSLMRMMLERRSYKVETALSGEQALEIAQGFGPSVVISDIGMPGMDGYEMMQALRAMNTLAPFKSIALSGYDAQEEGQRALAAGYDAQFTKPVDFEQLFRAIDSLATPAA